VSSIDLSRNFLRLSLFVPHKNRFVTFFQKRTRQVQLLSATAVKEYREHNATSFLMGQLSVAYGGTTEKLAQFFSPLSTYLDIASFID
jgi:hypothetical protein